MISMKESWRKFFAIIPLLATIIVLLPFFLTLSWCPDVEGLRVGDISSTLLHGRELLHGQYLYWNHLDGIGLPHPYGTNLIYHPAILLLAFFPLDIAIVLMYLGHALLGAYSTWYLCRHFKIAEPVAVVCVLTYLMSSPSLNYLVGMDFWPTSALVWTCFPLLLLLLCRFLQSDDRNELRFLVPAIAGLAGFMAINSHLGSLVYSMVGLSFFVLANSRAVLLRWKYTLLILSLFLLIFSAKFYTVYSEFIRFPATGARPFQYLPVDLMAMFFWPFKSAFLEKTYSGIHYRSFFMGFPFFLLALVGVFWPFRLCRFHRSIAISVITCLFLLFMSQSWLGAIICSSYVWRDPLIFFSIVLAGIMISMLFQKNRVWYVVAWLILVVQIVTLAIGLYPYWMHGLRVGLAFSRGENVKVLRAYVDKSPVLKIIEKHGLAPGQRIALTDAVQKRLKYYSGFDYTMFRTHQMPLVNGLFKGIYYDEVSPSSKMMYGSVDPVPFSSNKALLDTLGISFFVAFADEAVPQGLTLLESLDSRKGKVVLYGNPGAWAMATVLEVSAFDKDDSQEISHTGLLYQDYSPLKSHVLEGGVAEVNRTANKYDIRLAPLQVESVLLVNSYFCSPWKATGETRHGSLQLKVWPALGGLIAVDLPVGTSHVQLSYRPWLRIFFTAVTWLTLIGCVFACLLLYLFKGQKG